MTIVFWQRYPEDSVSSKSFTSDAEAADFLRRKNDDYSYTVGRAWSEKYVKAAAAQPGDMAAAAPATKEE